MGVDLQQKTYFLITGASRGIGQTMAIRVAAKLGAGSVVALLARSQDGLDATKAAIDAAGGERRVQTFCVDLGSATADQFANLLQSSLREAGAQSGDFQRAFIIHNAGTVGNVALRAIDESDTEAWRQYYHTNLFSVVSLNCEFFRTFRQVPKLVVNISSKCGIEPFASMSFYCSGKAARDMYFRVLAVEEEADTVVLNYAPGAIDTAMTVLVQQETVNAELSAMFKQQRDTKSMLTTEQTTQKFLQVLQEQKFQSGDHVDYWD